MAIFDYFFSTIILALLSIKSSQGLTCVKGLPSFKDQGLFSPMLLVGIQALVPAYKLSCNGTLIRWRVATVREGQHNIHLQVWRPGPEAESYTIVGSNIFNLKPTKAQRLHTLTPTQGDQIRVQAGDVLGFYLKKNNSNDFSIQYQASIPGISVLYRQISETIQAINHHTLPVELLNAAPIIQAQIEATEREEVTPSAATPVSITTTTEDVTESRETGTHTTLLSTIATTDPGDDSLSLLIPSVLAIILGVTCLMLIAVALIVGCKRKKGDREESKKHLNTNLNDEDYEYTRAVIIPPPNFRTHANLMLIAVPLKNNPIYEPIAIPSAHEYETPVLSPRWSHAIPMVYDVPRGHHDYENI